MTLTQLSIVLSDKSTYFNEIKSLIAANHVDMAIAHLQAALNSIQENETEVRQVLEELLK
jgi:hypothetical protein|uniref:Uncharacterized protein n=1 Tax=Siphoviridae sp. ctJ7x27 TaxID=2827835 RepID=A0A8S5S439_9CAUD|nr:MAG TPA: hypothetical protein [Siphoviridae sp. ctJ7x27]